MYGEDGTIQGLLELLKVPYVGCKVLASGICMDKVYAKMIFEKANINQAKAVVVNAKNGYTYVVTWNDFLKYTQEDINIAFSHKEDTPAYKIVKSV